MQSGDLRSKIRIQRQVKTGTGSFATLSWIDIDNAASTDSPKYIPAKWVNVHGTEAWTVSSLQAAAAATVTIRYRPDVLHGCKIVYRGITYDIVSIDNIRDREEFLEIKVTAAVMG